MTCRHWAGRCCQRSYWAEGRWSREENLRIHGKSVSFDCKVNNIVFLGVIPGFDSLESGIGFVIFSLCEVVHLTVIMISLNMSSCNFCLPVGFSSGEVIFWFVFVLVRSSFGEVVYWGWHSVRSSSIEVILHLGHLPFKLSYFLGQLQIGRIHFVVLC